ncbi:MAG: filamentous hemagglutinin N-terminal domain-containing protein [Rivularia sp. (in: Bacteria)]|nr:filamentous hemagglutinin N-terminal domain-containing protein [Rivularia sp. MS3]
MWGFAHRYHILLSLSLPLSLLPVSEVAAQLIPDNTLGKENSIVNSTKLHQNIDGGAIRGSNLFHSFTEFNISNDKSVNFSNPGAIQNILTRVTGKNPSQIFGTLKVSGNANLFLINPNGIVFGENAKLDIGGSFVGSTADNLKFADGSEFNLVNPSVNPILTISAPLGLQYGSNPGNIQVRGTAVSKLQVPDSKSLTLIAGNIKLDGGKLDAPAGGIGLLAVKNGEVSLVNRDGQIKLEVGKGIGYGNVELLNAANVNASGSSGGFIQMQGRNITLKDEAEISTNTKGNTAGEQLKIAATELLQISQSYLIVEVEKQASGNGGDLIVDSKRLIVNDQSVISSSTNGLGNAGALKIKAEDIQIIGKSRLFAIVTQEATGNGGDLTIETANLKVDGEGQIAATTFGKGTAGNMEIKANLVELIGVGAGDTPFKSGLFASAVVKDGQGGNLSVTSNRLIIRNGATINASNFFSNDPENLQGGAGTGAAGNININSPFIRLENEGIITANANAGDKGNINIQSQNLQLRKQSVISTNAKNNANGGNININTNTLLALENSDITANSEGSFGGKVAIDAEGILGTQFQPQLTPQSDITATSSLGASFNGVVDINTIAVNPISGLVELPETLADSSQNVEAGCAASAKNNFIVRGKGGLPQNPGDLFNGNATHTELNDLIPTQNLTFNINSENSLLNVENTDKPKTQKQIIEATGWIVNAKGEVMLVAQVPHAHQKYSEISSASCKDFYS